mgnify:FL=1
MSEPEETEPERTPEDSKADDLDALWQKTELQFQEEQEERAKKAGASSAWRYYKGFLSRSKSKPKKRHGFPEGNGPREAAEVSTERLDDLWKEAEMEIQRRRQLAGKGGFRVYDISDKGKGKGSKGKGYGHGRTYSYPSKSAENSWKDTLCRDGRCHKILLSKRQLNDRSLEHWCKWAQTSLARLPPGAVVSIVDMSFNRITAWGLRILLQTLKDADVPVQGFSLHHNLLNDAAASELARYLCFSHFTLHELHLSHNQISELGARSLLEAAVKAVQNPAELVSGRPNVRYPCERQGQRVPLWLRLSNNRIGDGRGSAWVRSFLQNMEHELLPTRRQVSQAVSEDPWGCHDHGDAHLFCEALSGYGCDHLNCTQMYPEISGLPPGPVVHLPMLDQQSREHRELQRGDRGDRGPRQPGTRGTRGTWTSGTSKTRGAEEVDLIDLDWEPDADTSNQGATDDKSKTGIATVLEDILVPEGVASPEVVLHAGEEVRILYEGSEDLDCEGFLFVSFQAGEGWLPASAVQR